MTDRGGGRVSLAVRIFTDDLALVAPGGDGAAAAYVLERVRLSRRDGSPIVLPVATVAHDGDLTVITAVGTVAGSLAGAQVQQTVLWERYRDQVNLLRATIDGHTTTLVFANGDPPRVLPGR